MEDLARILDLSNIQPLCGDASTRQYLRADQGILMIDDLEGGDERRRKFIDVSRRLRAAGLRAPKILENVPEKGVLLIEDLGIKDLASDPSQVNYNAALKLIEDFGRVDAQGLTPYGVGIYQEELSRLMRFYLKPLGVKNDELLEIANPLFEALAAAPSRFVHVDFHAENLILRDDGRLGILDFQDARNGHPLYDLASLVDDVRLDVPNASEIEAEGLRRLNVNDGEYWLCVISAQRLLKIIGIFARLTGEGRSGYAKFLPRCFALLNKRLVHADLSEWCEWVEEFVPKPTAENIQKLRLFV